MIQSLWRWVTGLFNGGHAPAPKNTVILRKGVMTRVEAPEKAAAPAVASPAPAPTSAYQDGILQRDTPLTAEDQAFIRLFETSRAQGQVQFSLAPSSAIDIMGLIDDPKCPVQKLAKAIESDPAIAGAVLKLANSSYFRGVTSFTDLHQAVVRLGQRQVKLLVMTVLLQSTLIRGKPYETFALLAWKHSLLTARLAAMIAERAGLSPDSAYMAGLFHNIGVLAALSGVRQVARGKQKNASPRAILDILLRHAGDVSGLVIEPWKLPEEVAGAVRHYRSYYEAGVASQVAAAVSIANDLGKQHGIWVERHPINFDKHTALHFLNLKPAQLPDEAAILALAGEIETGNME